MTPPPPPRWDIFCRVVDNFGDIGVCWRLARQLVAEHRLSVRLWVDELNALRVILPATSLVEQQQVEGVEVCAWQATTDFSGIEPADVVIEAFACELPPAYWAKVKPKASVWLNLEYLSAEDWVAGCHGLSSIHVQLGLKKTFFFPGFTQTTGGLIREQGLLTARDSFVAGSANIAGPTKSAFLQQLGLEPEPQGLLISLFGYENPALGPLLQTWQAGDQAITCLVPPGRLHQSLEQQLAISLQPGLIWQRGALRLLAIPFLAQTDYDRLLWACDLNFVRGEDSFVRAQWAAKPLIWHIYKQEENAHLIKLEAFLKLYTQGMPAPLRDGVIDFWRCWNLGEDPSQAWSTCMKDYPAWLNHSLGWCERLNSYGDLAAKLVQFCKKPL